MWQGRLLEVLGIWLVVAAFGHFGSGTNGWINIGTGIVVGLLGLLLRKIQPRLGPTAAVLGLVLMALALVPSLMVQFRQVWIDGLAGFAIWFLGWRVVASESGGPWRLKDRPVY